MSKVEGKAKSVPAPEFVRASWEAFHAGEGVQGIATRVGREVSAVNTRLSSLRKKGVNLPTFRVGGNNKLDIAELNEIANAAAKGQVAA